MKYHYPHAKTTTYKRAGIKASKARYPVRLMCLSSLSRVHGVFGKQEAQRHAHMYLLTMKDNGSVKLVDRDLTKKKNATTASFKQWKADVVVSSNAQATFAVKFSDGGTYGGVKSGSTFALAKGGSKRFADIPSGVLVTVTPTTSVAGCMTPAKRSLEVTKKNQKMPFTYR